VLVSMVYLKIQHQFSALGGIIHNAIDGSPKKVPRTQALLMEKCGKCMYFAYRINPPCEGIILCRIKLMGRQIYSMKD